MYRTVEDVDGVLTTKINKVSVELDAVTSTLELKASAVELTDVSRRVSKAEVTLDGIHAEIELKVSKNGIISAINLSPEGVVIDASKIDVRSFLPGTTARRAAYRLTP